jgi:hypothetical protein
MNSRQKKLGVRTNQIFALHENRNVPQEHDGVKAISGTDLLSSKVNTTGATIGPGTDYPSGASEFTPGIY